MGLALLMASSEELPSLPSSSTPFTQVTGIKTSIAFFKPESGWNSTLYGQYSSLAAGNDDWIAIVIVIIASSLETYFKGILHFQLSF